jgi:hypothetical protein
VGEKIFFASSFSSKLAEDKGMERTWGGVEVEHDAVKWWAGTCWQRCRCGAGPRSEGAGPLTHSNDFPN